MKLYHVTLTVNIDGIIRYGIRPDLSTGKLKVSWYVSKSRLLWAIGHVSAKFKVSPNELIVCEAWIDRKLMTKTRLRGVYTTAHNWKPFKSFAHSATSYLNMGDN